MTTTGIEDPASGSAGPLVGAPPLSAARWPGAVRRALAVRELAPGLVTLVVVAAA